MYAGYVEWSGKAYLKAAECLVKLGRPDEAKTTLNELLNANLTGSPEAQGSGQTGQGHGRGLLT